MKDLHVYMEPLINELRSLWENGVRAHDVSAIPGKEKFTLRAMLLCTLHDWPGIVLSTTRKYTCLIVSSCRSPNQ